jgi:hypothetical protein
MHQALATQLGVFSVFCKWNVFRTPDQLEIQPVGDHRVSG